MKFLRITSQVLLLAIAVVGSAFGATCSNASLSGGFGFLSPGFDAPGQPGTSIGQYVFDGKGSVSGKFTHSNGTISNDTFTGTYSVSTKNCTGHMVLHKSKGGTENHNFVIDDSKQGMQLIRADSPQIRSGFALAQGTASCTDKMQTFAFNLAGIDTGNGSDLAFVGQFTLDGKGKISKGKATFSLNGSIVTASLTGTYTENSDCTGTLHVVPSQGNPANFNSVFVNAGKEMLLIQTDGGAVVSGNAQQ